MQLAFHLNFYRPSLMTLMRDWTGLGERVKAIGSTDPKTDARPHVALMSLPRLFGTELHNGSINVSLPPGSCSASRSLAYIDSPGRNLSWFGLGIKP